MSEMKTDWHNFMSSAEGEEAYTRHLDARALCWAFHRWMLAQAVTAQLVSNPYTLGSVVQDSLTTNPTDLEVISAFVESVADWKQANPAYFDHSILWEHINGVRVILHNMRAALSLPASEGTAPWSNGEPITATCFDESAHIAPAGDSQTPAATRIQPIPNGKGPAIAGLVCADIMARNELGVKKYGEPLKAFNGRDPLVDSYQEALGLGLGLFLGSRYTLKHCEEIIAWQK